MSARTRVMVAGSFLLIALLALIVVGIGARETGLIEYPGTTPVRLLAPSPTDLDTVAIGGRRVTVSIDGIVRQIDEDGRVWLEWDGDAFPLALADTIEAAVEDHALVVGRLRSWRGRRWLAVEAWTPVTRSVR